MTIEQHIPVEQLVPQIVKTLKEIPWGERAWGKRDFWLAQMVVGLMEERKNWLILATLKGQPKLAEAQALRDFSLTESDWNWLKGKVRKWL